MIIAISILSNLFNYLLSNHNIPTMFFFTGHIIGIIPYLLNISNFKQTFELKYYLMVFIGIAIIVIFTLLNHRDKHSGETLSLSFGLIIKYYLAGICASSAMLLPSISGSFMLLVFGAYGTIMFALSELVQLNFKALPIIFIIGLGILTGFMISSRLIKYFLQHHTIMTLALIIGFVIGAICNFPWNSHQCLSMVNIISLTLIIGFIVSYILGKITDRNENKSI